MASPILFWAISALHLGIGNAASVSHLEPWQIGLGGGAITIHGSGFSEDVFNQFDPVLGNKVWFANELVSISCQTPINWNFLLENPQDPSTNKITCDLPPRVGNKGSDWFNLILKVDGEDVQNHVAVRYTSGRTPRIKNVVPRYGRVGDKVSLVGKIFTKEYGNSNFGDSGTVENRREASITAVMMGSRECVLTDDLGNVFNITLDSPTSNDGQVTCLPGGTFIGPMNATVFVSDSYGKSLVSEKGYSVNSKNQLFMYHTLPEITSVMPNVGASSGSTQLKIQGSSFDKMPGNTVVMIGETPCEIVSINNEEMVCSTPSEDSTSSSSLGSRGLKYEIWKETEVDISDISSLSTSAADYQSTTVDGSTIDGPMFGETKGYTARLSGYFVAPYTGNISFYLTSSDAAILYVSPSADPADKDMIIENSGATYTANPGRPHSEPIMMEKGNKYYIEAVHGQKSSSEEMNFLQISLWEYETIYHKSQTPMARDELQRLHMAYDRRYETQEIKFENMADDTEIVLTHDGIRSRTPITLAGKNNFNDTLLEMFTYTCEYLNTRHRFKQDYESEKLLPGQYGYVQENIQAYCGAKALENSVRILRFPDDDLNDINAKQTPWLCFAAKGLSFHGSVQFLYEWVDENSNDRRDWIKVSKIWTPSDDWSYQCIDMYESALNHTNIWVRPPANSPVRIRDIFLPQAEVVGRFYIDEVTISTSPVEIERLSPSLTTENILIKEVAVVETDDPNAFDVSIIPLSCNPEEEDLKLMGIKDAEIVGLDVSNLTPEEKWSKEQEYLKTAESATFSSSNWGSGTVTVTRKVRGSRALDGKFKLSYKNKEIELSPYPTDKSLASALEAFGMLGVRAESKSVKCYDLILDISFDYSLGGDIDQIEIDPTDLIVDNIEWEYFVTSTIRNGGIMVEAPGGDFFRTMSDGLSVNVYVAGFLSSCAAADCSFSYDSGLTPSVSTVSGDNSGGKTILTISGSGFSTVPEENIVTLGSLSCSVMTASSTTLECELEAGEAGVYEVSVIVANAGLATGGPITYEISVEITSNSPSSGSLGGGTTVTVMGSGFPNTMDGWSTGSVTIDGNMCKVIETSYTSFKCVTSPQSNSRRFKRAATDITVDIGGIVASGGFFEYDANLTPTVTSLSTYTSSPMGGEELTIIGTAFGAQYGKVYVGDASCTVLKWSKTEVTCVLPGNQHGTYPVHVSVPGNGYADVSGISGISYVFKVTNLTPRKGSLMGGTEVIVTGEGFGNCSNVDVNFGEEFECMIASCTDTEIVCKTQKKSAKHLITNSGRHPSFGPGYVWSVQDITIAPGDTINWIWNLQVASEGTKISVHQVSDSTSDEYDGVGFKSMRGANGRFSKTFMNTGTFYYSSEPVFLDGLFMKGVIHVVAPSEDISSNLSVTMNSIEAVQEISDEVALPPREGCAMSNDLSCVADGQITDTYAFTAANCLTPSVTSIEVVSGGADSNSTGFYVHNGAKLSITGTGFSSNLCENSIKIGNSECIVESNTESLLSCVIEGSDVSLSSLANHDLMVSILNKGKAVQDLQSSLDHSIKLMPKVDSVSSTSGSWAGGNLYKLTGSGLLPEGGKDTVLVNFGEYPFAMGCQVVDANFNEITCVVPDFVSNKGGQAAMTVDVLVSMGYDSFELSLPAGENQYEFKDDLTPTVSSKDTANVVANSVVEVQGTGIDSDVKVYLTKSEASRLRRRNVRRKRQASEEEEDFTIEAPKSWFDDVNWKCGNGYCNNDEVSNGIDAQPSQRLKRSAEEEEIEKMIADEFYNMLLNEICKEDTDKCSYFMKSDSKSVEKRSTQEELLEMSLGELHEAEIVSVSSNSVSFKVPTLPAGKYDIVIHDPDQGNAMGSIGALTNDIVVDNILPNTGSVYGGQVITISGSGFCEDTDSNVVIGSSTCQVISVSAGSITCITPSGTDGEATVAVESCSLSVSGSYTYSLSGSPEIASISPSSMSGAGTVTLSGSNFGSNPKVKIGKYTCAVTASTDSTVTCDIESLPGGMYFAMVNNNDFGYSSTATFESILNINTVTPSAGSFGGGSMLSIDGTGFDEENMPSVTVCNNACSLVTVTATNIVCITPANDAADNKLSCDVAISQESGNVAESNAFEYDRSLTPMINSLFPLRGGTGGGTQITISGSGFASTGNKVSIDGVECDVSTESETEIVCFTNPHNGAIKSAVIVEVPTQGYADYSNVEDATFYYIDRWSSIWTWGGLGTPLEGEYIVITNGQTILLDTSTPILKFLLIKGGTLMFDRENPEIELNTEYILLVEGGKLEIGTEEEPYDSKAIITMHGNVRCTELPIFGCKVIGVRNGTLDFHGSHVPVTWTRLANTVTAGSTEIVLTHPVTWKAGDQIALATTSDRSSMKENEEKVIASVSDDGYTISLTEPLEYQHISISQTFGDQEVETRGEVALLTRNILVRGSTNEQFVEVLPACEQEFNSGGAFSDAMQTCFAGKFGEELGSDEMGAIIIISPKYKDQDLVAARIEYTEFTNVGQAFRVGRYPIHFHLPGNMNGSYIRGNAIHHSNNRACTLHDVAHLLVEHNVAYNIKGLSFFLEDGVEQYNTLQYNLAVFTRMSNSLLNPDINPASFWIVNPNNKFRHNACAGGTHFCFWLRPARVPDGPSYTRHYCPSKVPFDEFHNNTAHSMGWYGFWIFGQSNHVDYDPHDGDESKGYCNGNRIQTTIGSFTTWNNKRGFEIVSGANIRLENQIHMDHDFAGYEIFTSKGPYGDGGPGIFNSIIVGHSEVSDLTAGKEAACTPGGIHITDSGYTIKDVKFFNFDRECYAMSMRLEEHGATATAVRIENVEFVNSPNKVFLEKGEDQGMWYYDVDGSLTGTPGSHLVGDSPTNPTSCTVDSSNELGVANLDGQPGSVCPGSVKFHRIKMVGENSPSALKFNPVTFRNDNGNSSRPFGWMVMGWQAMLTEESINWMTFDTAEHVTNISYTFEVSDLQSDSGSHVLIGHKFYQDPDRFSVLDGENANASEALTTYPTYEDNSNGDWYFNNDTDDGISELVYILSDKTETLRRKRAADDGVTPDDGWISGEFRVYKCYYEGCIPPPPPTLPPGRPLDFHLWSNQSAWETFDSTMPTEGSTVFIPFGVWMVMDIDPPPLKRIFVYGGLEIMDNADHKLEVEILFIQGGKFEVGTPNVPFTNKFELVLTGDHLTEDMSLPNGPNVGAKALGVFGFLDMHGLDTGKQFVKLAGDINAGDSSFEVVESVAWNVGSEIVITSTSYELKETEKRVITDISGTTITVDQPFEFKHTTKTVSVDDGKDVQMSGEVGLLSKNVRIVGNDYPDIDEEQFGGRVIVGTFMQDGITYTGYGRFENVEFATAGQDGWYDYFDPRYALAFLDTGDTIESGEPNVEESYVKKCSFNYVYNTAIGVFGSNNIPVEDNVIYRFTNDGIFVESINTKINNNLVAMGESIARIKMQGKNPSFFGCINIVRASNTTLYGNVMAGCAQAGIYTMGAPCESDLQMDNNEIHTTMHGIHMNSYGVSRPESGCVQIANFNIWKSYDYGVYTKSDSSIQISNIVAVDNGVGFLPYGWGPSSDSHLFEEKYMSISDSQIVGVSDGYDCSEEETKPDVFMAMGEKKRKWPGRGQWVNGKKLHHVGMLWPIFQAKYFKMEFPWHVGLIGPEGTNPALRGIVHVNSVTFSNFGTSCGGEDIVFRTNPGDDDMNWPINATNIKYRSVNDNNKIYIDEPIASKISPADCTDFDCDGLKKALIFDTDGSVVGDSSPGTIIPDSAFEWDGNPARGLGYYRVPKPMITTLSGDKIEYGDKMPNTGIYRDNTCLYNDVWRAYKCSGIQHRIMIIESMDRDTKIRRLSPLAVLANPGSDGYIDLVNGPQDHSCCSGYTCAERLSTLFSMVATGIEYEIMFSSIPPQNFRLHLLHNDGGEAVRLKIWFPKQQRLDIYVDGKFINPNNIDTTKESYNLLPPDNSYIPALNEMNGANYFDPISGHLYVNLKGPSTIDIKTQPVVVLKMGMAVPIENFFEENVIGNIAGLLGIDPSNIRVTNIVREGSVRNKRSAEVITSMEFEIGPPPLDDLENFVPEEYTYTTPQGEVTVNPLYSTPPATTASTTPWVPPENYLSFDQLQEVQAKLANEFQTGTLGAALNLELTGLQMEEPIAPPNEPPAYTSPEERAEVLPVTWAEQTAQNDTELLEVYAEVTLDVPDSIKLTQELMNVKEMQVIDPAPAVYVATSTGKMIQNLGDDSDPWQCTVSILSGPGGQLQGTVTVPFEKGIAVFDNLHIDQGGADYVLQFEISYPNNNLVPAESQPFEIAGRPLGLEYTDSKSLVPEKLNFTVMPTIWDEALSSAAESGVLAGLSWECSISLLAGDNTGVLTGTLTKTIAAGENSAVFDDLSIDAPGLDYRFATECSSPDYETGSVVKVSQPFSVHDYPETGMMKNSAIDFQFTGTYDKIMDVMAAFESSVVECQNCPNSQSRSESKKVSMDALKKVQFPPSI